MSIPCKFERSIVSYDEHEIILRSHHPEIYDVGLDDLKALQGASETRIASAFETPPALVGLSEVADEGGDDLSS